jgi:hypothetical protein
MGVGCATMVGYSVPDMKTHWLRKRASKEELDALRSVAEKLGLDASTTLWFLVREKQRELGIEVPKAGAGRSKKRRARAA